MRSMHTELSLCSFECIQKRAESRVDGNKEDKQEKFNWSVNAYVFQILTNKETSIVNLLTKSGSNQPVDFLSYLTTWVYNWFANNNDNRFDQTSKLFMYTWVGSMSVNCS